MGCRAFLDKLRALLAAAGLDDRMGTHTLRRSAATGAVAHGAAPSQAQRLGGWASHEVLRAGQRGRPGLTDRRHCYVGTLTPWRVAAAYFQKSVSESATAPN